MCRHRARMGWTLCFSGSHNAHWFCLDDAWLPCLWQRCQSRQLVTGQGDRHEGWGAGWRRGRSVGRRFWRLADWGRRGHRFGPGHKDGCSCGKRLPGHRPMRGCEHGRLHRFGGGGSGGHCHVARHAGVHWGLGKRGGVHHGHCGPHGGGHQDGLHIGRTRGPGSPRNCAPEENGVGKHRACRGYGLGYCTAGWQLRRRDSHGDGSRHWPRGTH
mmetsp:Transcript_77293/g.136296  ORF Transcript_77293/g.136296 Transcript_77293/m.136296 type:complete len:214 (+) Transcript_77293:414-1055(+)